MRYVEVECLVVSCIKKYVDDSAYGNSVMTHAPFATVEKLFDTFRKREYYISRTIVKT